MTTILTAVVIFTLLSCGITFVQSKEESNMLHPDVYYYEQENNEAKHIPLANVNPDLDSELERLSDVLVQILEYPWGPRGVPMVYVEDEASPAEFADVDNDSEIAGTPWKRSRYYRRYPWKRQNSRSRTYEADNRYMCQPTREDVFKLLVALHETRAGNGGRSINFCNRRRSANAIFTNIRFLGRK